MFESKRIYQKCVWSNNNQHVSRFLFFRRTKKNVLIKHKQIVAPPFSQQKGAHSFSPFLNQATSCCVLCAMQFVTKLTTTSGISGIIQFSLLFYLTFLLRIICILRMDLARRSDEMDELIAFATIILLLSFVIRRRSRL